MVDDKKNTSKDRNIDITYNNQKTGVDVKLEWLNFNPQVYFLKLKHCFKYNIGRHVRSTTFVQTAKNSTAFAFKSIKQIWLQQLGFDCPHHLSVY